MNSLSGESLSRAPVALTIAGSDSGGGAGIQADLKAFSALGVYGASVVTAVTAQNTQAVTAVHGIPVDVIQAQINAVLMDISVDAIKIGMLATAEIIEAVTESLHSYENSMVLDPVMVAKSGDKLLQDNAIQCLKTTLLPRAALLTPNLPEAGVLLDCPMAVNEAQMIQQAELLLAMGASAVLMKGGHGRGDQCVDVLVSAGDEPHRWVADRLDTQNTHGTGCTLSSAIAAGLAKGLTLADAVEQAHGYLHQAIAAADQLSIGQGHGPVHHFHEHW